MSWFRPHSTIFQKWFLSNFPMVLENQHEILALKFGTTLGKSDGNYLLIKSLRNCLYRNSPCCSLLCSSHEYPYLKARGGAAPLEILNSLKYCRLLSLDSPFWRRVSGWLLRTWLVLFQLFRGCISCRLPWGFQIC